jgi:group I intron endonuclease
MIIYKTTNLINDKIYIGQDSKNNQEYFGSGKYVNRAIKKYGKENFKKETICECLSKEELNEKEMYWIKQLDCKYPKGYNLTDGGGGTIGFKPNEETRKRMKESQLKRFSDPEYKIKFIKTVNKPETKQKQKLPKSESHKKLIKETMNRPEIKEKQREAIIKAVNEPETKERHKKALNTLEYKEKMKRPKTPYQCLRISQGKTGLKRGPNSPEANLNIRLAQQKRRENEKKGNLNGFISGEN